MGGLTGDVEGEEMQVSFPGFAGGDRTDIVLPSPQERLLEALHATGKPVVLVLMTGSALSVEWAQEHLPAILVAWYPGQRGGNAIADVLFGDANPGGRLPVTFYRSVQQLPPFADYDMKGRTYRYFTGEPLYPFGYGLSYTKFEYSGLQTTPSPPGAQDAFEVSVAVKNVGGESRRRGRAAVRETPCHRPGRCPRSSCAASAVSHSTGRAEARHVPSAPRRRLRLLRRGPEGVSQWSPGRTSFAWARRAATSD